MKYNFKRCKHFLNEFLKELKEELKEDLLAVALFGSLARGKAKPGSDIDMLFVYRNGKRDKVRSRFSKVGLAFREREEYKNFEKRGFRPDIFPVFLSEKELKEGPWVLLDIQDHGIILYDPHKILKRRFISLKKRLKELGSKKVNLPDGKYYWDLKPDWKPGEVISLALKNGENL